MAAKRINIKDKTFEIFVEEATIQKAVEGVAKKLSDDYADKNPVFVVVLNGAFVFAADVFKHLDFPCQISFTKFSSYIGTTSSGTITEQLPVTEDITGRHVVVIEDIVETGYSMEYLLKRLKDRNPASLEVCALAFRKSKCKVKDMDIKYIAMDLPEAFVVGYGFDYDQVGRQMRDIYALV
ncbi:MAG: hypoxanthine phosphoribosyltransferase [Prevotella sp.]|nr:hypoxanthine phosphoribosyltransferase [Candidatus Prevotella equi]